MGLPEYGAYMNNESDGKNAQCVESTSSANPVPASYLGRKVKTSLPELVLGGGRRPDSCNLFDGIVLVSRAALKESSNNLHDCACQLSMML